MKTQAPHKASSTAHSDVRLEPQRQRHQGQSTSLTGKSRAGEAQQLPLLQRKAAGNYQPPEIPPIVHEALRSPGRPLDSATRNLMEPRFGYDFSRVRIRNGSTNTKAAASTKAIRALAYTVGQDIVFGAGQYAPSAFSGRKLIAHELAHVIQQNQGGISSEAEHQADQAAKAVVSGQAIAPGSIGGAPIGIYRQADESTTDAAPSTTPEFLESETDSPPATSRPHTFERLYREHPEIALAVQNLSANYRGLIQLADSTLDAAGIYDLDTLSSENFFQRTTRRRVFRYEDRINRENLYDAKHISIWSDHMRRALTYLEPLLSALGEMGGDLATEAAVYENTRALLFGEIERLRRTDFLRSGFRQRRQEAAAAQAQRRLNTAIEYLRSYIRRHWEADMANIVLGMHSTVVANKLVHDMGLNADQIRDVFDTLQEQDPETFEKVLFKGWLIRALLERGISGLQAYRARGEGFTSGLIRGERESLLANEPGQRDFNVAETLVAVGGFVAGAFQGVGDSIISNIKGIVELFTPTFWSEITEFVTEFLPNFIDNEEFRFQIGQMMGQFSAAEIRRLATADPFEYGRTIGHLFGMALTEIVLSFIGLGWVLKAFRGSTQLARLSRPLAAAARRIGRSAIVARGLSAAQAIAEGIDALNRRIRQLRRRLPAFTATERFRRAAADLTETERSLQRALQRVEDLEDGARRALAAGDEPLAQRQLDELSQATDELEQAIAAHRRQRSTGSASAATTPAEPSSPAASPSRTATAPETATSPVEPPTPAATGGGGGRRPVRGATAEGVGDEFTYTYLEEAPVPEVTTRRRRGTRTPVEAVPDEAPPAAVRQTPDEDIASVLEETTEGTAFGGSSSDPDVIDLPNPREIEDLATDVPGSRFSTRQVWEPPPGAAPRPPRSAPQDVRLQWLRERLRMHVDQAIERFEVEGLTPRQAADTPRYATHRGSRIDQFAKDSILQDPDLADVITAPDFVSEPDILDSILPDWFDITTRRSWLNHLERYQERYGAAAHLLETTAR